MSKLVGILLAAGQSRRFGGQKCLAQLPDGVPMGLRAATNLQSQVDELVVVVPAASHTIAAMFQEQGLVTHPCETAALGMSESLKAGVRYFDDQEAPAHAYLIALADMPVIKPSTYQTLVTELRQNEGIVIPQYLGKRGHPVGFHRQFRTDLLGLQGDQGAKAALQQYRQAITAVDVDDPGIHQDFDTQPLFEQYFNKPST